MKNFLQKNGFYVILLMCIAIVAIAAVVMTNNDINKLVKKGLPPKSASEKQTNPDVSMGDSDIIIGDINKKLESNTAQNNVQKYYEEKKQQETAQNSAQNTITKAQQTEPTKVVDNTRDTEKTIKNVSTPVANATPVSSTITVSMIMPVDGQISTDYAMSNLIYSKTLDEWRTHNGIDIAAKADMPVKAAMAGIVEKVYKDLKMGYTVIIKHNGGYDTRYSSLGEDIKVKEGQTVKQGDIIGIVSQSASFEIAEGPHVHFEVIKDGKNVNPHDYIKQ